MLRKIKGYKRHFLSLQMVIWMTHTNVTRWLSFLLFGTWGIVDRCLEDDSSTEALFSRVIGRLATWFVCKWNLTQSIDKVQNSSNCSCFLLYLFIYIYIYIVYKFYIYTSIYISSIQSISWRTSQFMNSSSSLCSTSSPYTHHSPAVPTPFGAVWVGVRLGVDFGFDDLHGVGRFGGT